MAIVDVFSWPCPVDEKRTAILILTEDRLYYSLRAKPKETEALAKAASNTMIEAALPKGFSSSAVSDVQGLRRVQKRAHFQIIGKRGKSKIVFGDEEGAAEIFGSLARAFGMEPAATMKASKLEAAGNPLLCLMIVLLAGGYLGNLASQESAPEGWVFRLAHELAHGIGAGAIWLVMCVGLIGCGICLRRCLKDPPRVFLAKRAGLDRASLTKGRQAGEEELRLATADLLGIDVNLLTPETSFEEDLRIPPGELLSFLGSLEERLGLEEPVETVRSFGDLLAVLRKEG